MNAPLIKLIGEHERVRQKQVQILTRILAETKRPSGFRAFFIGFLFPEFQRILGHLSDLSKTVEK